MSSVGIVLPLGGRAATHTRQPLDGLWSMDPRIREDDGNACDV
jgi:hypothetical protein